MNSCLGPESKRINRPSSLNADFKVLTHDMPITQRHVFQCLLAPVRTMSGSLSLHILAIKAAAIPYFFFLLLLVLLHILDQLTIQFFRVVRYRHHLVLLLEITLTSRLYCLTSNSKEGLHVLAIFSLLSHIHASLVFTRSAIIYHITSAKR